MTTWSKRRTSALLLALVLAPLCLGASSTEAVAGFDLLNGLTELMAWTQTIESLKKMDRKYQIKLGEAYKQQLLKEVELVQDKEVTKAVESIARSLVAQLPAEVQSWPWEFFVVNDDDVNAFAVIGGKVFINTGLYRLCETTDVLAAVMAHEIIHVAMEHSAKQMRMLNWVQLLMDLGLKGKSGTAIQNAILAQDWLSANRTLDHEYQADDLGVCLLVSAGYRPDGAVRLFNLFDQLSDGRRGGVFTWFNTHPSPVNRREKASALGAQLATPEAARARLQQAFSAK